MAANSNIQIADLDFDSIKQNLKTFLRSQQKFKDYDFEGSGLSVLLDLLAYNTHYNSYYLNMVANEMFLDTAALRSSVVSHAKLLGYTPRSDSAPSATVNMVVNNVNNAASLTLPKFAKFQSESIDGVNYPFITKESKTVSVFSGVATFNDIEIIQGEPISLTFTYDSSTNKNQLFVLPDRKIDTATILVQVQKSSSNTEINTYNLAGDLSKVNGSSLIYFLQEGLNGQYEIYFGDNVIGKGLTNGNLVLVSYVVTDGTSAAGANNFVLLDDILGDPTVFPVTPATNGQAKESIDSIKFQAPKNYAAQGRAVSYDDYKTAIQQNKIGFGIDSVSVWGGQENDPPAFGQVFISIKPDGSYYLTDSQKKRLVDEVIKPISVVTVTPTVLDPDYTYVKVTADVLYDPRKTNLTSDQLRESVKAAILDYSNSNLNSFDSVFNYATLSNAIQNANPSIISNDSKIQIEKKFFPSLTVPKQYILNFGTALERSVYQAGIFSTPTFQYFTTNPEIDLIEEVYMEEVPFATSGIEAISVINPGFNYTEIPTVEIIGDGSGATAHARVKNGYIFEIVVDTPGNNYTQAIVKIVNSPTDTSGTNGTAYAKLQGRYGALRTYYYKDNVKTILNNNIGIIDYETGIITLNDFAPYDVNGVLGQLVITANPKSNLLSSNRNRIITIDPFDPLSVIVNVTAK